MDEIKEILSELGYSQIKDYASEYRMFPIYRQSDSPCLSVKKNSGFFIDYGRDIKGDFLKLVQISLNFKDKTKAKQWLSNKDIQFDEQKIRQKTLEKLNYKKFYSKDNLSKLIRNHNYWINRGVNKETLELFKGGLDNGIEGGKFYNRYVFPILDDHGNILGFSGRLTKHSERAPKWKHIGQKSHWTYPSFISSNYIQKTNEIIIVESIGDMLSLFNSGVKNVIVAFGVTLSKSIINFTLRHKLNRIVIALNNDSNNNNVGNKAAMKFKNELSKHFNEDKIKIRLPNQKDFGEMSKLEILDWYKHV